MLCSHQRVLSHEKGESVTKEGFFLKFVVYLSMLEVSMGKDPINSSTDRSNFNQRRIFQANTARKIAITVQKSRGPIESVHRVFNCRTFFRIFVRCTKEDPRLSGVHVDTSLGNAFVLN